MFAARADQENLAYAHQAAAAAKPLNQQAKTPANKAPKTPFRRNQNDENDAFQSNFKTGKTTKKVNLDPNAFITPAGPRNRAPLGMKTTNAKAKTPAPLTIKASAQKTLSPRLRRQKVKIHQAESIQQQQDDGVPDIEYMAPRSIPLPDHPDTIHERDYSMLSPEYATNGFWGAFGDAPDEHGVRPTERKNREMMARTDKIQQDIIRRALEADDFLSLDLTKVRKGFEEKELQSRAPSSLSARRAVSALSRSSSTTALGPRFAAPTATAAARSRTTNTVRPMPRKPVSSLTAPTASSTRHATAATASRNTLGYAGGRAVSAASRRPLSTLHDKPITPTEKRTRTVLENLMADDIEVEELLRERNARMEDNDSPVEPMSKLSILLDEDDEFKDFQLTLPE
ncbi:hypothetical protein E4T47_01486 [Aureobasidium subglaciale]|nr:hypothetical protein E4T43_03135 [Aureobasidium subglaciale]KAI5275465.1 hypothetical protein E4T47_01486 [Aureobasidium subglaciale]